MKLLRLLLALSLTLIACGTPPTNVSETAPVGTTLNAAAVVTDINAQYPQLLQTNTKEADAEFILRVVQAMPPAEKWGLLSKSNGENGYTWPNGIRTSHDAIAVPNGQRFDIIGGSDNPGHAASPTWNPIAPENWRPSNVWVDISTWKKLDGGTGGGGGTGGTVCPPCRPCAACPTIPGYAGDGVFNEIGTVLDADYREAGQALNAGSGTWFGRVSYDYLYGGLTMAASIKKHRGEWRSALGLAQ